ncbi:MAG: type I-E CRISPR-associated protein Cas7/Cse4/CasC [Planctomycetia bacterium]|nr:type I-E CRISPR-associated protein Cas7/Cse4/CasC [Planctomycetia bacterium]
MKLIELHLLQSFSATCLNRDDVGAPKSIFFGGVNRARVSSQCWKRAIRELAAKYAPEEFAGKRGHYHIESLTANLIELGWKLETAQALAKMALDACSKKEKKDDTENKNNKKGNNNKDEEKSSVALFFSANELYEMAKMLNDMYVEYKDTGISPEEISKVIISTDGKKKGKKNKTDELKERISKVIKNTRCQGFADIALMGRMVANLPTLTLEGAGMFSHAISTHAVANEVDFFSAVDDTKPLDTAGAAHIGTLELNSACYYRYIGLNVDLLFDKDHLGELEVLERKAILTAFLKAVIEAVPGARKNSMFGFTRPQYILGLVRTGQPLSLVNAFEEPVQAEKTGGYVSRSEKVLDEHWNAMKNLYNLEKDVLCEERISKDQSMEAWIDKMISSALEK